MGFSVRVQHHPECHTAVVAPSGDLDIDTAAELHAALAEAVGTGATTVAVDLAEVAFIDSTGIARLVWLLDPPGHDPPLVVVANVRPIVRNALRVMGLEARFTVHAHGSEPPGPWIADTRDGSCRR